MSLFVDASREKAKARIAITGVTGSGKTVGALYFAYGLTNDWSKVAIIDTEHDRAKFYAERTDMNIGKFKHATLSAPYSAERYKKYVIDGAALVGNEGVVIIDSFSHAWSHEGGVLDYKDRIVATTNKNGYTAWQEAGKVHNNLVNTILSTNCHTIVTMRSKMDYIMIENEKGKMELRKVGLAPIQRDDTEYEFDIVFDIARNHIAKITKDTTFLKDFSGAITPELGTKLKLWLDEGVEPYRCSICSKVITPTKAKSVQDIINGTAKNMGHTACMACYRKWLEENESLKAVSS